MKPPDAAAIVSVGDEILRGIVLDSNSQWIARQLTASGTDVVRMLTVADRPEEIAGAIRELLGLELVVVTGGLGPTADDRTLEGIAGALGVELAEDPAVVEALRAFYGRLAREGRVPQADLDEARRRMARLPRGAEPLPNPVGAAPGVWVPPLIVLPGVPSEMKGIWQESVQPRLGMATAVELTGVIDSDDESALAPTAAAVAARHPRVYLKTRAQDFAGAGIMVTASGPDRETRIALDELAAEAGLGWRRRYAPPPP
jgi:molybdenum cofactor synthesis domain-containing protein